MTPTVRPFRFGASIAGPDPARPIGEVAREIEDLGYAVLSCPDHLNYPDSPLEPMVLLTAAAATTRHVELQPLVMANGLRHPALLAKQAATLDLLSGGRFALGMGAGWYGPDFSAPGLPFPRPGERIAQLAEAIAVIRGLHSAEAFSFAGKYYTVENMTGKPLPTRRPMPLLIGGAGPRMLALAAREADTVALNLGTPFGAKLPDSPTPYAAATDDKLRWIRAAAAERADPPEIQAMVFAAAITDGDPLAPLQPLAAMLNVAPEALTDSPHVLVGSVQQCVDTVQAWRERWGISYLTIPGDSAAEMAPVVAALANR